MFYKFSNVNKGIPEDYCYNRISKYCSSYGSLAYIILFVIGTIILITGLAGFCLLK